jgi:hypothetical protein
MSNISTGALKASLTRTIIEIAQRKNGIIFGGMPRNKIRHDTAAKEFYEKCSKGECDIALYDDPDHDPETAEGRLILDNDVDIFFKNPVDVAAFKIALKAHKNVDFKPTNRRGSFTRSNNTWPVDLEVEKIMCSFSLPYVIAKAIDPVLIAVDIVLGPGFPPFKDKIDLECNSLMLTQDNEYRLMPCMTKGIRDPLLKHDMLNRIMTNIKNKTTTLVDEDAQPNRIHKILSQSWSIKGDGCMISHDVVDVDTVCFICHDEFRETEVRPYIKLMCCTRPMHAKCSNKWLFNTGVIDHCPSCGSIEGFTHTKKDRRLIEILN